jgi:peptidoglycan-associated lipoprotein
LKEGNKKMRLNSFGPKLLSVAAAALLLAACESASNTGASSSGTAAPATAAAPATTATAPANAIRPGSQQDLVVNIGDRVFFDYDKSDLKPAARATLDKQSAWLKQYGQNRVVIEGHCDERGTREYNLALGERRANSAKTYLINSGIAAARVTTISYGKERPVALGSNEAAWSQNRRAVTVVANYPSVPRARPLEG